MVLIYIIIGVIAYITYYLWQNLWVIPREFLSYYGRQGIKGKWKFLVGQMPEIRDAAENDKMVELGLSSAEELGMVHITLAGPLPQLCVQDLDMLRDLFGRRKDCYHKSSDSFKEVLRPLLRNGLLLSEDDFHRQQRKLVSPAFHFHNLKEMVPLVVSSTQACMQKWINQLATEATTAAAAASSSSTPSTGVQVEISKEMTKLTLNAVSTAAFGSAFYDDATLSDRMTSNLKMVLDAIQARTLNLTGYLPVIKKLPFFGLPQLEKGCRVLNEIVAKIVADRKAGKSHAAGGARNDLLDLLLGARGDDGEAMSDAAVQDESLNFIAAGAETTSNLITWLVYRLVTIPEYWQSCVEEVDRVLGGHDPDAESVKELKFIEAAAYEALRLHPPAPMIPKMAIVDNQLGKYQIRKGTIITVNTNIIHRSPLLYDDPNEFRPSRFLSSDLSNNDDGETKTTANGTSADESASSSSSDDAAGKKKKTHPYQFLSFSAGPRKCIGKNLAMLEIKVIVAMLVQRFTLKLVPGQKIVADGITRLPRYGLYMQVAHRPDFDPDRAPAPVASGSDSTVAVSKPLGMI